MFGVDEHNDYRGDVNILDTLTWQWKPTHDAAASVWTIPMIVGLVLGILLAVRSSEMKRECVCVILMLTSSDCTCGGIALLPSMPSSQRHARPPYS